jgi:hypothetical protein
MRNITGRDIPKENIYADEEAQPIAQRTRNEPARWRLRPRRQEAQPGQGKDKARAEEVADRRSHSP